MAKQATIVLVDDGTMDTVFACTTCGVWLRYTYGADESIGDFTYDEFVAWARADAVEQHGDCPRFVVVVTQRAWNYDKTASYATRWMVADRAHANQCVSATYLSFDDAQAVADAWNKDVA